MPNRFTFEHFVIDLGRRRLTSHGRVVRLQPQPFALLELLISHAGQIVTRAQMHRALWADDTHVSFDTGLNTAMRKLRRALGEIAEQPRFVVTEPGIGYRFIAVVTPILEHDSTPAGADPEQRPAHPVVVDPGVTAATTGHVPSWLRGVALLAALCSSLPTVGDQGRVPSEISQRHAARAYQLLAESNRVGAAIEFDRAVATGAREDRLFVDYACVLAELRQLEAALAVIEHGLEQQPRSVTLLAHRGLRLHAVGRYEEELAALAEAVALDPRSVDAQFHLGLGFARRKQYDASIEILQLTVALSGHAPQYVSWLGRIAADAGRMSEAESALAVLRTIAKTMPVDQSLIDAVAYHLAIARMAHVTS